MPSSSPGRMGRVVALTDIVILSSASRSIRLIVDFPAPEGEESTIKRPRRWRVGWSMTALASGKACPSSDGMVHCTKKLLKWCGAPYIVQCNKFEEELQMANETKVEAEAAAEAPAKVAE